MNIFEGLILGIVQGITEWLPVSSSGHLVILEKIFGIASPVETTILLHLGTLLALIIFMRKDLLKLISKYWKYIIVGTIPAVIAGLLFKSFFESLFSNVLAVGIALLATGIILFFSERRPSNKRINLKNSIVVGIGQAFSIVPGISRSGITISTGLYQGVKKEEAVKFSFLLSIPAVIGAAGLELRHASILLNAPAIVALLTTAIVAYLSLKFLMELIKKKKFHWFAYYCFVLGIVLLLATALSFTPGQASTAQKQGFCGWSTNGTCSSNSDCIVGGCSSQVCQSKNEEPVITTCIYSTCYNADSFGVKCICNNNKCQWL